MTNVMTESDYLEHFGVRGMKWGVRKQRNTSNASSRSSRYKAMMNRHLMSYSVTAKNGDKLDVNEERDSRFGAFINSFSKKRTKEDMGYHSMSVSLHGKKIGNASVADMGNGELNLVWLGVNSKYRGKGYGSAVFESAMKFGRDNNFKRITLEVPGTSPDARHIYEKHGFKVTKEASPDDEDDVWGGLTNMEYTIDKLKHSAMANDTDDLDKAISETFEPMPKALEKELYEDSLTHSDIVSIAGTDFVQMTESDFLEHFGIPGMKWGVRRNRKSSSRKSSRKSKKESRPIDAESDFLTKNKKRDLSTMSNEELQRINTRMNLENNYKAQSKNYRTNNRSVASNLAYNLPAALLTATVSAVVGIYAQRGAKGIDNLLRKGVNRAFTLKS